MQLSPEQEYALQKFEEGQNLFITGPGGTGKTTLIHYLIESAKTRNKKVQVCALTGCAALLLKCGARTIHSWSGLRLARGNSEDIVKQALSNTKCKANWKKTDILVIDEVSMMSKKIFEILNEIGGRSRLKTGSIFGGVQIIFSGDFYQLPPVGNADDPDTEKFCFESPLWTKTFALENHIQLTTMFRQKDPLYQSILGNIRQGFITEEQKNILSTHLTKVHDPEKHHGCVPVKLFPIKAKVLQYNQYMFDQLTDPPFEYSFLPKTNCLTYLESGQPIKAETLLRCNELSKKDKELELEYLLANTPCLKVLQLKRGANVMCTYNLDIENGICNGSIGVITNFNMKKNTPFPVVRFSNGVHCEIPIQFWQSEEYPSIAIGQFPLCLSWALTIHKIQGASLPLADIDIGHNVFECGQSYVALSRVETLDGLYLSGFLSTKIRANEKVKEFYLQIPNVEYSYEDVVDTTTNTNTDTELQQEEEKPNSDVKIIKFVV